MVNTKLIVLDTETTGLNPKRDRIVEIGCIELNATTTNEYHIYINPGMPMPQEAYAIHGLTDAFLAQYKPFADQADAFLSFIKDATLVAHNAKFDIGFLNAELARSMRDPLVNEVIDTLSLARARYPNSRVNLDALSKLIFLPKRTKHSALEDAKILGQVYLKLLTKPRQLRMDTLTATETCGQNACMTNFLVEITDAEKHEDEKFIQALLSHKT